LTEITRNRDGGEAVTVFGGEGRPEDEGEKIYD
jgi:hypothetical protein